MESSKRILIICAGNTNESLYCLPLIRLWLRTAEDREIHVCSLVINEHLFRRVPGIYANHIYQPEGTHRGIRGISRLVREFRFQDFGQIIHFQPDIKLIIAALATGIKQQFGLAHWLQLSIKTTWFRVTGSSDLNKAVSFEKFINKLVKNCPSRRFRHFGLVLKNREKRMIRRLLQPVAQKRVFLIHLCDATVTDPFWQKNLLAFAEWVNKQQAVLAFTGDDALIPFLRHLFQRHIPFINLLKRLDFTESAALVQRAELYICDNSALPALAHAFNKPVIFLKKGNRPAGYSLQARHINKGGFRLPGTLGPDPHTISVQTENGLRDAVKALLSF